MNLPDGEPTRVRQVPRRERRGRRTREASRGRPGGRGLLRWLGWVVGAFALVAIGAVYFGVAGAPPGEALRAPSPVKGAPADPRITLRAGEMAPDFALPAAEGGKTVRLSELRASSEVLLFFQEGAMCPPCWQQMRDLRGEARLRELGVALVTIAVDPPEVLRDTAAREQVTDMTLLYDEVARTSKAYQATYVSMHPGERPGHTFVLVGKDGIILWRQDFREMHVPNARILDPVARALGR